MKIGYPNHPRRNVIEELEWIARSGFDFVDLCLEPDRAAIETVDTGLLRRTLRRLGLEAVGHTAWYLPIGSPMSQLRKAAVSAVGEYLRAFADVGVAAVTVHADWPTGMFTEAEGLAWQIESLTSIRASGERMGVKIMYEQATREWDTPENMERVLGAVPGLLCHLDLGHCHLHGRDPAAMVRRFAGRLYHVHVHDNTGQSDLHLPPGTGSIRWPEVFAALREGGYDRTLTLEVFSEDRDYVILAKKKVEAYAGIVRAS
jgi:sugar phosphate isomerase/epimerase